MFVLELGYTVFEIVSLQPCGYYVEAIGFVLYHLELVIAYFIGPKSTFLV